MNRPVLEPEVVHPAGTTDTAGTIDSAPFDSAESIEAHAEQLYRRCGARPGHLIPEATRTHHRGLAAAGVDGQDPLPLPAAS